MHRAHAVGGAYLPLLEAWGDSGQGLDGACLVQVLHRQAPSWLVHLPALVPRDAFEPRTPSGARRESACCASWRRRSKR